MHDLDDDLPAPYDHAKVQKVTIQSIPLFPNFNPTFSMKKDLLLRNSRKSANKSEHLL